MNILPLLLLACAQTQESPTLLPSAPENWRFERINFPLDFAPDLAQQGFEELWFAPGMFDPKSDSYFSYAFAMRIEDDLDLDARSVVPLLDEYYRGLCTEVGKGRGLEIAPEEIRVTLEEATEGHFTGRIDMIDAFVTGKPLSVAFDLTVHPRPGSTEVLGLASPQPKDAAIWKELHNFEDPWRKEHTVPVFLNHTYAVPDQETFDALVASGFLREAFAVTEERTTVRNDLTYSGLYLYGKRTYFEFLPPSADRAAGSSGIAFGLETLGRTGELARELKAAEIPTFAGPLTRKSGEEDVPWFEIMGIGKAHAASRMDLFTMEYDPRFLKEWHGTLAPKGESLARRAVLQRYAAKLEQDAEKKLFEDVVAVALTADEKERGRLFETLRVFGYEIEESAGGGAWVCRGPQVRLDVAGSEEPGRVTGLEFRLRKVVELGPMEFGGASLRFEGRSAWLTLP